MIKRLNRQNPLTLTDTALIDYLSCIERHFGSKWLETITDHPLGVLWKRKDFLSTEELYILAVALKQFEQIDMQWTKRQCESIKNGSCNNRAGALFEVIGLSYFLNAGCSLRPEKESNPGYDATLFFEEDIEVSLSLKNYQLSAHYQAFIEKSRILEKCIQRILKACKSWPMMVFIDFSQDYPSNSDWIEVESLLKKIIAGSKDRPIFNTISKGIVVGLNKLTNEYGEFSEVKPSYHMLVLSNFHKNEILNLTSKIDEACYNLKSKGKEETDKHRNFLILHLPENAPIIKLIEWSKAYFSEHTQEPLSAVLLYQPSVANTADRESTYISHYLPSVFKPCSIQWFHDKELIPLRIEVPVGVITNNPSSQILYIGNTFYNIDTKYIWQSGHYYTEGISTAESEICWDLRKLAPGVFQHAVIQPIPNGRELILSGIFPKRDELLIL